MPGPGFEPGLLRPQRRALTTRRSRLTIPQTAAGRQKVFSLTLIGAAKILQLELYLPLRMRSKIMSLGNISKNSQLQLQNISNLSSFLRPLQGKDENTVKKICRYQDSNLGYCGNDAVSQPLDDRGLPFHRRLVELETENLVSKLL